MAPEKHPPATPAAAFDNDDENTAVKGNQRRVNRIAAMQFLYAWDANKPDNLVEAVRQFFTAQSAMQEKPREYFAFAEELVNGAVEHADNIDEAIRSYSQNWAFNRIAKVDLAILRLAGYELLHRRDIPPVVTINEAVELTKLFSAGDAKRFVNGVLDRIKAQLGRPLREAAKD